MERIRNLNRYQKAVLLLLLAMAVVFTAAYSVVTARVGFSYEGAILLPREENGDTVYEGRIKRKTAVFTVTADKTVTFTCGEKVYGPYTAHEDPSAVPDDSELAERLTGVEIREGEEIFFRGGIWMPVGSEQEMLLFDEDGTLAGFDITYSVGDGKEYDSDGNVIDPMAPSELTILQLMSGPELTHKGDWLVWLCGVAISMMTAVLILFADELFRWNLAFQIRHVEQAEPSEWEIMTRYIAWTVLPVMALIAYITGLTA